MPSRIPEAIAFEVMIKAKLRPVGTYRNASSPWECICETCGELVTPSLLSIKSGQGGCAYCAGKKVNPDSAKALMIRNGYEPLVDYPGSKVPTQPAKNEPSADIPNAGPARPCRAI